MSDQSISGGSRKLLADLIAQVQALGEIVATRPGMPGDMVAAMGGIADALTALANGQQTAVSSQSSAATSLTAILNAQRDYTAALAQLHGDLANTIAGYVDGLESGNAAIVAKLDTVAAGLALLHADNTSTSPSGTPWTISTASGGIITTTPMTLAAAATGKLHYLRSLFLKNVVAVVGTEVVIKAGATDLWRSYAPASMLVADPYTFDPPLAGIVGKDLLLVRATTGTKTYASACGFTV